MVSDLYRHSTVISTNPKRFDHYVAELNLKVRSELISFDNLLTKLCSTLLKPLVTKI